MAFQGNTEHLISLYAIGVFISFTVAQSSMVVHWNRERGAGWQFRAFLNGLGSDCYRCYSSSHYGDEVLYGAWIVLVFIPIMIYIFKAVRAHYNVVADQLHLPEESYNKGAAVFPRGKHIIIVPVATPTRVVYNTIKYAKTIGDNIIAVNIADNAERKRSCAKNGSCGILEWS